MFIMHIIITCLCIIANFTVEGSFLIELHFLYLRSCMRSSCLLIMTCFSLWRFSFFRIYYGRLEHIGGHLCSCSFNSSSEPCLSIKLNHLLFFSHTCSFIWNCFTLCLLTCHNFYLPWSSEHGSLQLPSGSLSSTPLL